jgi:hypothetical protein
MGTSQSSAGPGAGVALVPPWAEDPPGSPDDDPEVGDGAPDQLPTAEPGRFRDARRSLGDFARTGSADSLRRSLHHYVSSGYGGSAVMGRRLGGTASTAGRLDASLRAGTDARDAALASGGDVNAILDAIVEAARPVDGTQDSESTRAAIRDSLSELLERFPDADLTALSDVQREFVLERYVALDVLGRFCLDMQRTIIDKAPTAAVALQRLGQIRAFINEEVAAAFRRNLVDGQTLTSAGVAALSRRALRDTLRVFEDYVT